MLPYTVTMLGGTWGRTADRNFRWQVLTKGATKIPQLYSKALQAAFFAVS